MSYYRCFKDRRNAALAVGAQHYGYPELYSRFTRTGEHNGLKLSPGLIKRLFIQFMETHEKYLQASFQTRWDEGNLADHTHKYSKVVQAPGRKGRVFAASYTIAALIGFINVSRLVFTKTMFELQKIMHGYKLARGNANAPCLGRFESDNLNGDGGLWIKHFEEGLMENVSPPLV